MRYLITLNSQNGDNHRIEIYKAGYTGTTVIVDKIKKNPTINTYNNSEWIIGSEFSFSFITKNIDQFNDLFEANFKEFKVIYKINGQNRFIGFLNVDGISSEFITYNYEISLSFTDLLAELDKFNLNENLIGINFSNNLLFYLKQALSLTDIELDFVINCNIKTNEIGSNETAFEKAHLRIERFNDDEKGVRTYWTAKKVVENIVRIFNCRIFQSYGKYYIINNNEINTKIYLYNWSNLALSSTAYNFNEVETVVSGDTIERTTELSKIRPYRTSKLTYFNKFVAANFAQNYNENTFWINQTSEQRVFLNQSAENWLQINIAPIAEDTTDIDLDFISVNIPYELKTNEDKLRLTFDYRIVNSVTFNNYVPFLNIEIILPDNSVISQSISPQASLNNFEFIFDVTQSGNYKIRLWATIPYNPTISFANFNYQIQNLYFSTLEDEIFLFDQQYEAINTDILQNEIDTNETYIGDGIDTNDVGNLRINSSLTSNWSGLTIQELFLIHRLNRFNKFQNKIRITLINNDFDISFFNKISLKNQTYQINKLTAEYGDKYNRYTIELWQY